MIMQSKVKKDYLRNVKIHNDLSQYAKKSWRNMEAQKDTKTWNHFLEVLCLIIQDQGWKYLVESNGILKGVLTDGVLNDGSGNYYNEE